MNILNIQKYDNFTKNGKAPPFLNIHSSNFGTCPVLTLRRWCNFYFSKNVEFWWLKNKNMYSDYFSHQGLILVSVVLKLVEVEPNILNILYLKKGRGFFEGNLIFWWLILLSTYWIVLAVWTNLATRCWLYQLYSLKLLGAFWKAYQIYILLYVIKLFVSNRENIVANTLTINAIIGR